MDLQFSKYARVLNDEDKRIVQTTQGSWDHDHQIIALSFPGTIWEVCKLFNRRFPDVPVPQYHKVLVCGAGPSFDHIPTGNYDCVILTPPIADNVADMFNAEKVVVDGEREGWVPIGFYPKCLRRPGLFKYWARERYVCSEWPYTEVYWAPEGHAKSSGALALEFAERVRADEVDVIGIDLTGHYQKFTDETKRALNALPQVRIL